MIMNTYKVNIKLENGDEVQARSVGNTPQEAVDRILESKQFKEFNQQWIGIESIHYELEQAGTTVQVDATRYDFQPSKEREGWYVVTDKKDMVVVIFEKGKFNETQRITRLDDTLPNPLTAASGLKAIADYLHIYHPEVL
jgi:uncharacterized lipoprotein YehR (DUF1307 family)